MRRRIASLFAAGAPLLFSGAVAFSEPDPLGGEIHRLQLVPRGGEKFKEANYALWVPEGVTELRALIVHQHGCGDGAQNAGRTATDDLHWRLLAEHTGSALLGTSLWPDDSCRDWCNPDGGSGRAFLDALDTLAERSGHAELREVPWVVWGHSGGGFWTHRMLRKHPDRFAGAILQSAGFGKPEEWPLPKLSDGLPTDVPMLIHVGGKEKGHERFNALYENGVTLFEELRAKGATVALAVDPASGHDCGDCRYLTIPWILSILSERQNQAFLGIQMVSVFQLVGGEKPQIIQVQAVLPETAAERAGILQRDEILEIDGESFTADAETPAHIQLQQRVRSLSPGDSMALTIRRAADEIEIEVTLGAMPKSFLGLWLTGNGHQTPDSDVTNWLPDASVARAWKEFVAAGHVADPSPPAEPPTDLAAKVDPAGIILTWRAKPDLQSGIKTFRIYRDGKLLPPYRTPTGKGGKATELFRKPNYSDTPSPPLAEMRYVDREPLEEGVVEYQVSTINWAGLESEKSDSLRLRLKR